MQDNPKDLPLTRRELARLLHAFAHFLEASDAPPLHEPRRHRGRAGVVPREEMRTAARTALRRLGVLP